MYTLLVDTHMTNVTIIIYKDGKILKKENVESKQSHSIITLPLLKSILNEINIDIKDINEIAVVNGPGSFTGVRIGVTIAKTISYCLNVPIKVISSLEVLAVNIDANHKFVALNDRNGYFIGEFDENNNLLSDYTYMINLEYKNFKENNIVYDNLGDIDYEKVYAFLQQKAVINPHSVKPLYVKKIEVLQ